MTVRKILAPCGTCDLTMPSDKEDTVFCHGGPPSAFPEIVAVTVQGSNGVEQRKVVSSAFPPVGKDKPGCALHPKLRGKMK